MMQSLTEFTCVPDFGRKQTTFDVHVAGESAPVARVRKDGVTDSLRPYAVFDGPQLDHQVGWVNSSQALTAEGAVIGEVSRRSRTYAEDDVSVSHAGLPPLGARPEGVPTRVTRTFPMNVVLGNVGAGYVLGTRLRFSGPGCEGFSIARRQGVKSRYTVTVHDQRIDRLVPLSCVLYMARNLSGDLRQEWSNRTSNPFKL
jgi:hypothetical protein